MSGQGGGEGAVSGGDEVHFPGPAFFRSDKPAQGTCEVVLQVPELKTKKAFGILGARSVAGGATVEPKIETSLISVTVVVPHGGGKKVYKYEKDLSKIEVKLDTKETKHSVEDKKVILLLCNEVKESWAPHNEFLTDE